MSYLGCSTGCVCGSPTQHYGHNGFHWDPKAYKKMEQMIVKDLKGGKL